MRSSVPGREFSGKGGRPGVPLFLPYIEEKRPIVY
jgi:hypothetical protein